MAWGWRAIGGLRAPVFKSSPWNSPWWIVIEDGVRIDVKCVNLVAFGMWMHKLDSSGAPPGVDGICMRLIYSWRLPSVVSFREIPRRRSELRPIA